MSLLQCHFEEYAKLGTSELRRLTEKMQTVFRLERDRIFDILAQDYMSHRLEFFAIYQRKLNGSLLQREIKEYAKIRAVNPQKLTKKRSICFGPVFTLYSRPNRLFMIRQLLNTRRRRLRLTYSLYHQFRIPTGCPLNFDGILLSTYDEFQTKSPDCHISRRESCYPRCSITYKVLIGSDKYIGNFGCDENPNLFWEIDFDEFSEDVQFLQKVSTKESRTKIISLFEFSLLATEFHTKNLFMIQSTHLCLNASQCHPIASFVSNFKVDSTVIARIIFLKTLFDAQIHEICMRHQSLFDL